MEYRSEIAIVLENSDYEELARQWRENFKGTTVKEITDLFDVGKLETPDDTYVCIYRYWIERYANRDGIKLITNFLKNHRHSMVEIGEDGDTTEDFLEEDDRGVDKEFQDIIYASHEIAGINRFRFNSADQKQTDEQEPTHQYTVISYWEGEHADSKVWIYDTEDEAVKAMNRLWEQSFNEALNDDNFDEDGSYHEDFFGVIAWDDELYRYFEVIEQESEEKI